MYIERADVDRRALQGRVAVVTGAGQGIGRETARVLAYLGAAVAIAEIGDTGLQTERLIRAQGGRALFVRTDVSDPESMARLRREVSHALGPVDILVNNAVWFAVRPLLDVTVEEWDRVFAVNLRGAFLGIHAFMPEMLERRRGVIVTMESADSLPYLAAYSASKVGLRSLAASLAQEVGDHSGVAVYCFGAGMVETPSETAAVRRMAPLYGLSEEEFIRQSAPGGRLVSAELCATGLVGTILHAHEFHGEETGWVVGLSKLGLSPTGEPWQGEAAAVEDAAAVAMPGPVGGVGDTAPPPAGAADRWPEALALNRKLEEILQMFVHEYDELTRFQRVFARRLFQQGTGLKVEDWLAGAQAMSAALERAAGDGVAPAGGAAYVAQLQRLSSFLTKQESDARGWMRDPEMLRVALEALRERKATVDRLASHLVQG